MVFIVNSFTVFSPDSISPLRYQCRYQGSHCWIISASQSLILWRIRLVLGYKSYATDLLIELQKIKSLAFNVSFTFDRIRKNCRKLSIYKFCCGDTNVKLAPCFIFHLDGQVVFGLDVIRNAEGINIMGNILPMSFTCSNESSWASLKTCLAMSIIPSNPDYKR
jgi:hypothetical protein